MDKNKMCTQQGIESNNLIKFIFGISMINMVYNPKNSKKF